MSTPYHPDVAAIAGKPTAYHGYTYVIEFSNGTTKVGQTRNPRSRVKAHRDEARKFGVHIRNLWISNEHREFVENERLLIAYATSMGNLAAGSEYFSGCSFADVSAFAAGLPASTIPEDKVDEMVRASAARAREFADSLVGKPVSEVPPLVAALFMNPEELFATRIALGGPRDEMLSQIDRLAKATGDSADQILDEHYIAMLGRIAISMIRTKLISLEIWADGEGRDDLLATYREVLA